jgi:hypothetical protein
MKSKGGDNMVDFKDHEVLPRFTDKELKVYKLLCNYDETGKFSKVFDGIFRTLNDRNNPARFLQASNSIRWIADEIMNKSKDASYALLDDKGFESLKEEHSNLSKDLLRKITDKRDRENIENAVNSEYGRLHDALKYGTRRNRLLNLLGSKTDLNSIPELLKVRADSLANTYNYFANCVHNFDVNESEFIDKWLYFQDFLIQILSDFFEMVKEIDPFLEDGIKICQEIDRLKTLISKPKCYGYFFRKFDNADPMLFELLNNEICFYDVPDLEQTEEGNIIFPGWGPGKYLGKVANRIPDKVLEVLTKIKTENYIVWTECAQIILKMPDKFLIENYEPISTLFGNWIIGYSGFVANDAVKLFEKYIALGCLEGACKLLDILGKTTLDRKAEIVFRAGTHNYALLLGEKYLSSLIDKAPVEVMNIIEKHFRILLDMDSKNLDDTSSIWRASIEPSDQNRNRHDTKSIFVDILRDTAISLGNKEPDTLRPFLDRWIQDRLSIFQRIAIHCIGICDGFDDLVQNVILDRSRFFGLPPHYHDYHEFILLIRDKYYKLSDEQKKQFLNWIVEGPPIDSKDDHVNFKQTRQLRVLLHIDNILRKDVEKDDVFKQYCNFVDKLKNSIPEIKNPSFLRSKFETYWIGSTSELSKEQIAEMSIEEFIEWSKINLQPPYSWESSTPEGVARVFKSVVKEIPLKYAQSADEFIDGDIFPVYPQNLIEGLKEALKEGKTFDLGHVIRFIENPLKFHSEPKIRSDEIGDYSSLRGTISEFIEVLVDKGGDYLTQDILDRTQNVLTDLIERDDNPTEEQEKQYGPDANNMDYFNFCTDSNRGKAMHALIRHALCRAAIESAKTEKPNSNNSPFPPGQRMNLYKQFFTERLNMESSPSVQSSYGYFLPQLFYLDQDWVKQMKEQGKLFPKSEERYKFWNAHWQGYLWPNEFYNQIFELLRDDYLKAVYDLGKNESEVRSIDNYNNSLTEHLITAYWREIEDIGNGGLIDIFFEKALFETREFAVGSLVRAIEEIKPSKDSNEWKKIKKFLNFRAEKGKADELISFIRYLEYCPEDLDEIVDLIKQILSESANDWGYYEDKLLEYLDTKVETNSESVLSLLNDLLRKKNFMGNPDLIRSILVKGRKYSDNQKVVKYINQAVNRLGEMGYYDFLELHI